MSADTASPSLLRSAPCSSWAVLPCEEGTQAAGGCTLVGERFLVPVYAAGGGLFFLGGLGWIVGGLLIRFRREPGERSAVVAADRAVAGSALMSALQHNSYFEGGVQSIGFERNGRRFTAGVIAPGEFHFGTGAPERMTVVSGSLLAKLPGAEWALYPAGTAFEVPGESGFDVRADAPAAYLCEFL